MDVIGKKDMTALFNIGYGLYVISTNDGEKDNGFIANTVCQLTSDPCRIAVTVNKQNYSHEIIQKTGKMNVNCISKDAPFSLFERFGFVSGRDVKKFALLDIMRSDNGLAVLTEYVNAFFSLEVESYTDLGSHGMFICTVTNAAVLSEVESMTYAYYHAYVKPKPPKKTGYVCKICGYVYEGEPLPDDFICPICKHPASDFEKL